MPVIKREQNITECLNNAVKQQTAIHDATSDILRRPASIWYNQKFGSQKIRGKKSRPKKNPEFDIHTYEMIEEDKGWYVRTKNGIVDWCMSEDWIDISRLCSLLNMNPNVRMVRLMLACLLIMVLLHMAPKQTLVFDTPWDSAVFYLDLLTNISFLLDSVNRAISIPMHIRVSKAFGRETNGLDLLLSSGGLRDAPLVIMCLSFGLTPPGMWLRLILLISLTPSFIEAFPHLSILLLSISGAAGSIMITIMLFFLAIIIYASFGHILFGRNDPYHFGTYGMSLWTFFHFAVFDNWMEVWNLNYYGCDQYPSDSFVIDLEHKLGPGTVHTRFGSFDNGNCVDPQRLPIVSTLVFISFIFLCAYVLMNTAMAAVVIGIKEGLDVYKNMTVFGTEQKIHVQEDLIENSFSFQGQPKKKSDKELDKSGGSSKSGSSRRSVVGGATPKVTSKMLKMTGGANESKRMAMKLEKIWKGKSVDSIRFEDFDRLYGGWDQPIRVAAEYERILQLPTFGYGYVACSLLVAILQILTEMSFLTASDVFPLIVTLQIPFTLDVIARAFTFYVKKPKDATVWGWVYFSGLLTLLAWSPIVLSGTYYPQVMNSCNMLRLIDMLQYINHWMKDLELIMKAFFVSQYGILLLCLLVLVNFLYFIIAGIMLFRESDPGRFGSVSSAFSTMIQIMTYDNMDDTMHTNMLGCNYHGYNTGNAAFDNLCSPSARGLGWISPIYFVCLSIMISITLMSALIGLIISSMEKLLEIKSAEIEIWKDVDEVARAYEIPSVSIPIMLSLFEDLDKDGNCHLTFVQLQPMIECAGMEDEQEQFTLFIKVDRDGSGQIEFPEFCELLSIMGLILNKTPFAVKKARMAKEIARFKKFDKEMEKATPVQGDTSAKYGLGASSPSATFTGAAPTRGLSETALIDGNSGCSAVGGVDATATTTTAAAAVDGNVGMVVPITAVPTNELTGMLKATKTAADRKAMRSVSTKHRADTMRGLEHQQVMAAVSKRERDSYMDNLNSSSFNPSISPDKPSSRERKQRTSSVGIDSSSYAANLSANVEQFANSAVVRSVDSKGSAKGQGPGQSEQPEQSDADAEDNKARQDLAEKDYVQAFLNESNDEEDSAQKRKGSEDQQHRKKSILGMSFTPIGEEDDEDEPHSQFFEDVEEIVKSKNIPMVPTRSKSIFSRTKIAPSCNTNEVRGIEVRDHHSDDEQAGGGDNSAKQSNFMDDIDSLLKSVDRPSRNNSVVVSLVGNNSFGGDHYRSEGSYSGQGHFGLMSLGSVKSSNKFAGGAGGGGNNNVKSITKTRSIDKEDNSLQEF